jgi:hypothetical protein
MPGSDFRFFGGDRETDDVIGARCEPNAYNNQETMLLRPAAPETRDVGKD